MKKFLKLFSNHLINIFKTNPNKNGGFPVGLIATFVVLACGIVLAGILYYHNYQI